MFIRTISGCILILAAIAFWQWQQPLVHKPMPTLVDKDDWRLPTEPTEDLAEARAQMEEHNLWGDSRPPQQLKPLTPPNWRITGVYAAGNERFVLLNIEQQPLQQLKQGERLPGGAKILKIDAEQITIALNGKTRQLKVYKE
jgi:hypothetical protein